MRKRQAKYGGKLIERLEKDVHTIKNGHFCSVGEVLIYYKNVTCDVIYIEFSGMLIKKVCVFLIRLIETSIIYHYHLLHF